MPDWFACYDTRTGELISTGTVVADPLPRNVAKLNVGTRRPSPQRDVWNPALLVFEDKEAEITAAKEAIRTEETVLRQLLTDVETEEERLRVLRASR